MQQQKIFDQPQNLVNLLVCHCPDSVGSGLPVTNITDKRLPYCASQVTRKLCTSDLFIARIFAEKYCHKLWMTPNMNRGLIHFYFIFSMSLHWSAEHVLTQQLRWHGNLINEVFPS
jgi:hypothetical protein